MSLPQKRTIAIGVALGVLAWAVHMWDRKIANAWRADNLIDTDPSTIHLENGPWANRSIRLAGRPTVGAHLAGKLRWIGFDETDGYYTVTEVSVSYRSGKAAWTASRPRG